MKSKEADLLVREDTSEKVKYDQYVVFGEQWHLDDLNCSEGRIRGEVQQNGVYCLYVDLSQLARVYNKETSHHDTNHWKDISLQI